MTHIVSWPAPPGRSVNPYVNPVSAVRRMAYARMRAALDLVDIPEATRVLDFGCWAGYFLPSLLKRFPEVCGVDDDSASVVETLPGYWTILQLARTLCRHEAAAYAEPALVRAGGLALPFRDECFDIVFCLDTLAHVFVAERRTVLAELHRVTKQRGQLIFSLPIETGAIGALKQAARVLTGKKSDPKTQGYDFRCDLELFKSLFEVRRTIFFPVRMLRSLNPFLFVDCRIEQAQF